MYDINTFFSEIIHEFSLFSRGDYLLQVLTSRSKNGNFFRK